ncbi:hypothetical protein HQ529_05065 [Candidatus Woesearchaeota archaeon]|nr:hypothetical protein [Candidatus Woesearchaeota archaeon]
MNLVCAKCNYKFEKDKTPKLCPYCGKEGSMGKTKSAQDFLNESLMESDE